MRLNIFLFGGILIVRVNARRGFSWSFLLNIHWMSLFFIFVLVLKTNCGSWVQNFICNILPKMSIETSARWLRFFVIWLFVFEHHIHSGRLHVWEMPTGSNKAACSMCSRTILIKWFVNLIIFLAGAPT